MNKRTEYLNPNEQIAFFFKRSGYLNDYHGELKNLKLEHVSYDKNANEEFDYKVTANCTHDGTLLFAIQTIEEALIKLINRKTYCPNTFPVNKKIEELKDISYVIGDIKLENDFYRSKQKTTVTIPVVCSYVF
ncbi:hypothetical protein [Bacillus amyloliquefaciens]|uniref:hypothetical protein n=1 Tax=Bacillus amyloliquefaciens TaxID=1390 RepID=UPI000E25BF0D|nr:hypothetical protein [Bacillus amyloliquefaciens]RDY88703.1 hypothetical protein C3733_08245 [Bacillus amyloliquefaciens]